MFLERILEQKRREVEQLPYSPKGVQVAVRRRSLSQALGTFGLIAEVKKASPSKGVIRPDFDPVSIARRYEEAGANAISVLTDQPFFQGDLEYLRAIREVVSVPLLRKDFIIDCRQIDESVRAGADAVLLIAAALTDEDLADLVRYAQERGLEVLLEVHTLKELDRALHVNPDLIGINNRDLHTFEVSLDVTRQLMPHIPDGVPVISESGISSPEDVRAMKAIGASGVLVGEFLMRYPDVADGLRYLRGKD